MRRTGFLGGYAFGRLIRTFVPLWLILGAVAWQVVDNNARRVDRTKNSANEMTAEECLDELTEKGTITRRELYADKTDYEVLILCKQ